MYSPFPLFYFLMVLYTISYFGENTKNHQFLFSKGPLGGGPRGGGSPGGGSLEKARRAFSLLGARRAPY